MSDSRLSDANRAILHAFDQKMQEMETKTLDEFEAMATNPETSGAKLLQVLYMLTEDSMTDELFNEHTGDEAYRTKRSHRIGMIGDAVHRNPSIPFELLYSTLMAPENTYTAYAAWHNPSVQLLMLSRPDRLYAISAAYVFTWLQWGRPAARGRGVIAQTLSEQAQTLNGYPIGTLAQRLRGVNEYTYIAPYEIQKNISIEVRKRRRDEAVAFGNMIKKYFPEIA